VVRVLGCRDEAVLNGYRARVSVRMSVLSKVELEWVCTLELGPRNECLDSIFGKCLGPSYRILKGSRPGCWVF
jgi:hypothetical protein